MELVPSPALLTLREIHVTEDQNTGVRHSSPGVAVGRWWQGGPALPGMEEVVS